MSELQKKIFMIVNENVELSTDKFDTDLTELGMNSIILIIIVISLEETFKIEIPDDKLLISELNTFNKIVNIVSIALENVNKQESDLMA